jgi:hypothetical protein
VVTRGAQSGPGSTRWLGSLGAVLALLVACGGSAPASSSKPPPQSLNLIVAGLSQSYMQAYLSLYDGAFDAENVSVNLKVVSPGAIAATIISGQADVAMSGPATVFPLVKNGQDASIIYQTTTNGISGYVVGSPRIRSVKDCTKFATSQQGSTAYAWAEEYKKLFNASYTILQLTDTTTIPAAVVSGNADCAGGAQSNFAAQLQSHQVVTLIDPANPKTLPSNYPKPIMGGCIWGVRQNLQSKKAAVVAFIRGLQTTLNGTMKKDSLDQMATLMRKSPDFQAVSQPDMVTALQQLKPYVGPSQGNLSSDEWTAELDWSLGTGIAYLSTTDPLWSYKQRVDMSYYNAATKS